MKVSRAALAKKLQVTRQRVHTMIQEGLITPDARGLSDLDEALTAIAANRDPAKGGKQAPVVEGTFHEHRTRKEAALARLREFEAAEKEQALVNAEDIQRELKNVFTIVRQNLRAIPAKAAGELCHIARSTPGRQGEVQVMTLLLKEIDQVLLELSQWTPETNKKGRV